MRNEEPYLRIGRHRRMWGAGRLREPRNTHHLARPGITAPTAEKETERTMQLIEQMQQRMPTGCAIPCAERITMRTILIATLGAVALLAGCSSPPKPPRAVESTRAPANDPAHIEALKLQAEMQRARVELAIANRQAASDRMLTEAQALGLKAVRVAVRGGGGIPVFDAGVVASVYTVTFPTGSTKLSLSAPAQQALVAAARNAELVELRGRTDAKQGNATDAAIARQRALAPQVLLLQAGIPASRIRATWQAAGDHAAPNDTVQGRAMNRRVEIVVHRIAPRPANLVERATVAAQ